jgi:hypothetical protein
VQNIWPGRIGVGDQIIMLQNGRREETRFYLEGKEKGKENKNIKRKI